MRFIAFGKNVVEGLVESQFFTISKLIISEKNQKEYQQILKIASNRKINCQILTIEQFGKHIPDRKHQGIIAFVSDYRYSSLNYVIKNSLKYSKTPLIVILDSVEDPHNFGAITRVCSAIGVSGIVIARKQQVPVNNTVIKVSAGGISQIPICQVEILEEALNTLKLNGFSIISTVCEQANSVDYRDLELRMPTCLIFGNEHDGVRNNLIKKSNFLTSIPMKNKMNSLNVSVSCGIIAASLLAKVRE